MEIVRAPEKMQEVALRLRREGRRIAFVPTMGALHEGHLALLREGKRVADVLVISVFVNPLQFGPDEDLETYPRDLKRDRKLAEADGADFFFAPETDALYGDGFSTEVEVSGLTETLCGAHRPGHFRGVATVVAKLFNAVKPHVAVFGEKDYQQLAVIRRLVADLNFDIEIVGHPTVREPDGLAMSSRNLRLTTEQRQAARGIKRGLDSAASAFVRGEDRPAVLRDLVRADVLAYPKARIEYVTLCDPETLKVIDEIRETSLLAVAVYYGSTRLIDHVILRAGDRKLQRDRLPGGIERGV